MYAHTPNDRGRWHELSHHLRAVAEKAGQFARDFGGEDVAYLAGLWHDLGKYDPSFQSYLRAQAEGRRHRHVRHAYLGALLAFTLLKPYGQRWEEVVLPIAGHHAGLASRAAVEQQMVYLLGQKDQQARVQQLAQIAQEHNLLPDRRLRWPNCSSDTRRELFVRMVFSAVVDADYLDTEAHFQPAARDLRGQWPSLRDLWERLRQDQERLMAVAAPSTLNAIRREVYEACLIAAELPPGAFRLTVPTGGGKTRSALAFALRHALAHGLRRVVVAIPYTSIIDQTVEVYRRALGEEAVLEHHSQVEVPAGEGQEPVAVRLRLACENWDAPLVVTTTVQLFESLFSNRPSQVRRLHNLAKAVIVLDEVQTLPPEILRPTVDVLRALVEDYGVSVVLSTATQPVLEDSPYLREWAGMEVREIVPDHSRYFQILRRVEYERRDSPVSWEELARELAPQHQAMIVLNTRRDALELMKELDKMGLREDSFHLSTLLCGAHRRQILGEVRRRLAGGQRVLLVSTQVVEAGVDLDFPVVYRAVGPLDRIVQAAGRCNREGRLKSGRVVIFQPTEGGVAGGPYEAGMEVARLLLRCYPADALHDPAIYREYFSRLFADIDLDKRKVQEERTALNYPEVAKRYRLIVDDTVPVVVPYGDAEERLAAWLREPTRHTWQRLQPYLVSIFRHDVARLQRSGLLHPETEGLFRWLGSYHPRLGLQEVPVDPGDLIV